MVTKNVWRIAKMQQDEKKMGDWQSDMHEALKLMFFSVQLIFISKQSRTHMFTA